MWDDRYRTEEYIYGTEPNEFLKNHINTLPPEGKLLCLASGEGRNAVFLAEQGYDVTAIDASSVGLEKARKLAQQKKVKVAFVHEDLNNFDLGESVWDGIVSIFCHLPSMERKALYQRVQKALRPGGVFLLEAYTPNQLFHGTGGPTVKDYLISKEQLEEELPRLIFSSLKEIERSIVEGSMHTGRSSVVQLISSRAFNI